MRGLAHADFFAPSVRDVVKPPYALALRGVFCNTMQCSVTRATRTVKPMPILLLSQFTRSTTSRAVPSVQTLTLLAQVDFVHLQEQVTRRDQGAPDAADELRDGGLAPLCKRSFGLKSPGKSTSWWLHRALVRENGSAQRLQRNADRFNDRLCGTFYDVSLLRIQGTSKNLRP